MKGIERVADIIPAHNEGAVIARCVSSVRRALAHPDLDRLDRWVMVVADRCADDTAERARRALELTSETTGALLHVDFHSAGRLASFGAVEGACWVMDTALQRAAAEIDSDPSDRCHEAMRRALIVRHVVERGCQEVLQRLARAAGPRATAFDAWFAQQSADLAIYLQQCHGERDLETLGRSFVGSEGQHA